MPLLGKHKSLPGSGQQQQQPSATGAHSINQQQASTTMVTARMMPGVCESPLFGLRRQLPMVTVPMTTSSNSSSEQHSTRAGYSTPNSIRSRSPANKSYSQSSSTELVNKFNSSNALPASQQQANESTLGSIPKHITRQQIHYAFSIMDTNSDGLIDTRDLSSMLANLGIPIDESILAHVLTGASKRGDHRLSENEFLEWLGHFVQVKNDAASSSSSAGKKDEESQSSSSNNNKKWSVERWRSSGAGSGNSSSRTSDSNRRQIVRSSTAGSSLVAVSTEPIPVDSLRRRRGSGSGLALMRSLSSSSSADAKSGSATDQNGEKKDNTDEAPDRASKKTSRRLSASLSSESQQAEVEEARNDLRAAFCVFDLDGDGFITLDEVRAGLKLLGESWSPVELNQVFSRCSGNNKGGSTTQATGSGSLRSSSSLRTADMRQRISIEDFVRMLL